MKIAVTGSTGLIGSALLPVLEAAGHSVTRLVRPGSRSRGVEWDPAAGRIDRAGLEGHDAIVHLAGENIGGLWTPARKRRIRASRVNGTQLIAETVAGLERKPAVLVSASAMGYYGNRPASEPADEAASRGNGFLSEVTAAWEAAAEPAAQAGIRVALPRFSLVLSGEGGSLAPMLPLFKLGLGGRIGSGRQIWSWIAIDDVARILRFILETPGLSGPINVAAPTPVSNAEFTETLGRVLHRPTLTAAPAFLLKAVAGQMAEELLLSGVRVVPRKLAEAGYVFQYPELSDALAHVLGRE